MTPLERLALEDIERRMFLQIVGRDADCAETALTRIDEVDILRLRTKTRRRLMDIREKLRKAIEAA
jgi:hypothetical protein